MLRRCFVLVLLAIRMDAADPWLGTWKMDPAKSKFPGDPPTDVVLKFEAQGKGFRFTSSGKLQDGTPYSYYFVGAADGKQYEVKDHPGFQTASAQMVGARLELRFLRDGKVAVTHRCEFRDGGKVMFNTSEYANASGGDPFFILAHFERQ